jgi:hypothetical protein
VNLVDLAGSERLGTDHQVIYIYIYIYIKICGQFALYIQHRERVAGSKRPGTDDQAFERVCMCVWIYVPLV